MLILYNKENAILRGDWPVKFWSQNVPEQVFVFFQVWVPKHAKIHTQKGSKEHLFIMTQTPSMQICGELPFVKPQNDT